MIDIETLALSPNAAVLQIGAAAWKFDEDGTAEESTEVEDTVFRVFDGSLNLHEQIKLGREINADTLGFHLSLGAECLKESVTCKARLTSSLFSFTQLFKDLDDYVVLSRGSAFDFPILESLMRQVDTPVPWKYNQVWDHRTIVNLMGDPHLPRPANQIKHDGYWDARFQLKQLITILGKMSNSEESPVRASAKLNLSRQKNLI
jgi:hypothetical protein